MPPRSSRQEPKAFYELGKQGRKTGVSLHDPGVRDEQGFMPVDGVFSSPSKAAASTPNGDQTGEQDMELDTPGPGPATVLRHQHLPRGRSPLKTNLQSPAVRHPRLRRTSSQARGSVVRDPEVEIEEEVTTTTRVTRNAQVNGSRGKGGKNVQTNGNSLVRKTVEEEEEESILQGRAEVDAEDSMQLINESIQAPDEDEQEEVRQEEQVDEQEEEDVRPKPRARRPSKKNATKTSSRKARRQSDREEEEEERAEDVSEEVPENVEKEAPKRRSRPPKNSELHISKKRSRTSMDEGHEPVDSSRSKKPKTLYKSAPKAATVGKGKRGRKLKYDDVEASLLQVQQGPPLPRSRGLVSIHRDASDLQQTRSGRHSYRPLEYWKGEHVEFEADPEGNEDIFRKDGHRMVLPSIKEVVRVKQSEPTSRKTARPKRRPKANTSRKLAASPDDASVELEDWERVPGRLEGETVCWEPDYELLPPAPGEPAHVTVENIALSCDGIVTKDVKDATFKFAKTMNLPFMGTGIVDLPPGTEKRPKNSRKMQMAFFVFYGKVKVTVHENEFRISTGGCWFVPRGNYYSICNDYDHPARIFFAQACEVKVETSPVEFENVEGEEQEDDRTQMSSHLGQPNAVSE